MNLYSCLTVLVIIAMVNGGDDTKYRELLTAGNNNFTAKMFSEVAKTKQDRSFVLSAFSVLTPLAQLSLASDGDSHDELLKAIGLPDDESTKSVFSYMNSKLRTVKGVDLKMANKIYVAKNYDLNDNYAAISRETFESEVKNVDFTHNEETAKEINAWVEDQTNHRIKNLVDPQTLTSDTRAVLVNAIYFKGMWKNPFNKMFTSDSNFHVSRENTIKVPTMYRKGNYNYGEIADLNAKILAIPYEGDESAFYIILPNNIDGITELEEKLKDPSILDNALKSLYEVEVEAYIPKFKIETSTNLKEILPKIGVKKIFSPEHAKLNKLLKEAGNLYVSEAIQKAFIEINEEGAEAAAANEFGISYLAAFIPQTIRFVADHPFVFVLKTGQNIIFNGIFYS
ncbi:unnamed protein product [Parnassius apollo]|uniref:(apollo) hypothetical protein n=1 Tax=Parnassius apollo TaxID=110799 RepID=A0A8S3XR38_PARAO|nr:unnamed protein product [Parnassius apollo]